MFGGLVGSTSSHVQTSMENIVFFLFFYFVFLVLCVCVFSISLSFVSIRQGLCMDNKKTILLQIMQYIYKANNW